MQFKIAKPVSSFTNMTYAVLVCTTLAGTGTAFAEDEYRVDWIEQIGSP